jgi:hypothetical protein
MSMTHHKTANHGDISLFIMLIVLSIFLAAGVLLSTILSQQLKSARDVEAVERALYAADAGLEEALFRQLRQGEINVSLSNVPINYDAGLDASYDVTATRVTGVREELCIHTSGAAGGEVRRLKTGPTTCP